MTMAKLAPSLPAELGVELVADAALLVVEARLPEVVFAPVVLARVLETAAEVVLAELEVELARVEEAELVVEEELAVEEELVVEELALEEELDFEELVEVVELELELELDTSLSCAPSLPSTLMLCQLPVRSP
jgi:hypothetical protein